MNEGKSVNVFRILKYTGPIVLILIAVFLGRFSTLDPSTLKTVQLTLLGVAVAEFFLFDWMSKRGHG